MAKKELIELGRLIIDFPVAYMVLKGLTIEDCYNDHGRLCIQMILKEEMTEIDALKLKDTPIRVADPEGEVIFYGISEAIQISREACYTELTIHARSLSSKTDIKKKSRTLQDPGKTLSQVAKIVMGDYGGQIEVKEDIPIPDMLDQANETDWAFLKRVAGQYGFVLFTDCKSETLKISIGPVGFGNKQLDETAVHLDMQKPIASFIQTACNTQEEAVDCEFIQNRYESYDLSIGSGYLLTDSREVVMKSKITAHRGTVTNQIILKRQEGTYSNFSEAAEQVLTANIIVGTVIAVQENEIKVHFEVDGAQAVGSARWIAYENEMNNYMYNMPDIGDQVFVYYDKQGKVIAMGSKHSNGESHPDFEHPENKSLTACDKMIKFTPNTVEWVGSRSYYDQGDGPFQAQIIMNKKEGIDVYSTHDIVIDTKTQGHGSIIIHGAQDFIDIIEPPITFEKLDQAGNAKYKMDGGLSQKQQIEMALGKEGSDIIQQFKDGVVQTVTGPFQIFSTVKEMVKPLDQEVVEEAPQEIEQFETGVVYLMAQNTIKFIVGESCITLSNEYINIKTPLYSHVGFTHLEYEQVSEPNRDWLDTILDGTQLVLDIVGCLPIPIVGEVADLINAGISLARGDYFGAVSSLISAIPGGDLIGKGMKAAKAVKKIEKAADTVETVLRVVQILATGAQTVNGILENRDNIIEVTRLLISGEFDCSNQEHWDMLISAGRSTVLPAVQMGVAVHNRRKSQKERLENETQPKKKLDEPEGTNKPVETDRNIECVSGGDPINLVTGSFLLDEIDLYLEDLKTPFYIKRTYESIYTNTQQLLGSKWLINIGSYLSIRNDEAVVLMPDTHIEKFKKQENRWVNERHEDYSFSLMEMPEVYRLTSIREHLVYEYDKQGLLMQIIDKNFNHTRFKYINKVLTTIELASKQKLQLTYDHNKLAAITDNIGRTVQYCYEGELLTEVIYPHGGKISYTYTQEGYIETATNLNGKVYLNNQYDRKGRVTKQKLSTGEEYILLYNEADRTNTLITTSKDQTLQYQYNLDKLVTKTIYPDGTFEEKGYDDWQNVIYEKDRLGRVTRRKYNDRCLLLEEQLPGGLNRQYEYDEEDYLIRQYDNAGSEVTFKYDAYHNLIEKTSRLDELQNVVERFEYDSVGRRTKIIDPAGNCVTYEYSAPFNEPTLYMNGEGQTFEYTYDAVGRNMEIHSEYGKVQFAYNHRDNKTMIIDEKGGITKYDYDRMGNIVRETEADVYDPYGNNLPCMSYIYNDLGKCTKTIDQLGNVFAVTLNTEGKVTKEINPNSYDPATDDGEGIIHIYDSDDRAIKLIYPDGGIRRIKYDAAGNIIKIIQPEAYDETKDDGPGYVYTYDEANRLKQITAPDGNVQKRFIYDLKGFLIKEIDAKGYLMGTTDDERPGTRYTYNLLGWLLEERVPLKAEGETIYYRVTQYSYNLAGDLTVEKRYSDYQDEKSAHGNVHTIQYEYDKNRHLIKVSDCTGAVVEYHYDCLGQRTYEKQKINETINQIYKYQYDGSGNVLEMAVSADKQGTGRHFAKTKYTYDAAGRLLKTVTPKGYLIERNYDIAGRMIKERHYDKIGGIDHTITFEYDKAGNVIAMTDGPDKRTLYEYDLMNRMVSTTNEAGGVTRTFYNRNGQITKQIQPNQYALAKEKGKGLTYTYDIKGQIISVKNALGEEIEKSTYNVAGELIGIHDSLSQGIRVSYDLGGRREKVETEGGSSQQYLYDARGNITGLIDGNGVETKYQLDKWGRILLIEKGDATQEKYSYDYAGNITTTTDGNGNTITYNYNALNKLSEIIDQEGHKETFIYNEEGDLLEYTDRNQQKVHYEYNIYGSLLRKYAADSSLQQSYQYYPDGRLKSAIAEGMQYEYSYYKDGSLKEKKASGRTLVAYSYDLNGNKITQTDVTGKTTHYHYNILDQLTEIVDNNNRLVGYTYHPDGSLASCKQLNGLETTYTYDIDKNLTHLEVDLAGKKIVQNGYTYDKNGNRTQKQQLTGTTKYSYDRLNRLQQIVYPTYTEELFYDQAGNRKKRLRNNIEERYSYDNRNRLEHLTTIKGKDIQTTTFQYDQQGNLLKDGNTTYTYDAFNRTKKIETFDGKVQINHYDAEGLRHEIEEDGKLVQFIFSDREVIVEKTETDTIRLIRGYNIAASESEQARTYYHYVSDEQGSTTHIFKEKELYNLYEYDAFGNIVKSEENVHNRFKYTGQQYDPITQQYYLRARYYNPVIARFTQEDPYRGDGLNLYAYCANNPVMYNDPSGYAAKAICSKMYKEYKKRLKDNEELSKGEQEAYERHLNEIINGTPEQVQKYKQELYDEYLKKGYKQNAKGQWYGPDGKFVSNINKNTQSDRPSTKQLQDWWINYTRKMVTGEIHHGLPFEYREWFEQRGIDVNNPFYFFDLDFDHHRAKGTGVHSTSNSMNKNWNAAWKDFIEQNPNATVVDIEDKLNDMAKNYGIAKFRAQKK